MFGGHELEFLILGLAASGLSAVGGELFSKWLGRHRSAALELQLTTSAGQKINIPIEASVGRPVDAAAVAHALAQARQTVAAAAMPAPPVS